MLRGCARNSHYPEGGHQKVNHAMIEIPDRTPMSQDRAFAPIGIDATLTSLCLSLNEQL